MVVGDVRQLIWEEMDGAAGVTALCRELSEVVEKTWERNAGGRKLQVRKYQASSQDK